MWESCTSWGRCPGDLIIPRSYRVESVASGKSAPIPPTRRNRLQPQLRRWTRGRYDSPVVTLAWYLSDPMWDRWIVLIGTELIGEPTSYDYLALFSVQCTWQLRWLYVALWSVAYTAASLYVAQQHKINFAHHIKLSFELRAYQLECIPLPA